jgi:dienelactone hydrolase
MRPLEIVLVLALAAILLQLLGATRAYPWLIGSIVVAALMLALHCLIEGPRWQMYPAYFCLAAIVVGASFGWQAASARLLFLGSIGLLALLATAPLLAAALPVFQLPAPRGSYRVGTEIRHVSDPSRSNWLPGAPGGPRELMVQLWYPADATAKGPLAAYREKAATTLRNARYALAATHSILDAPLDDASTALPVILFTPSWWGQRGETTFLAEDLASHGYVVVAIDHVYSAWRTALPGGKIADTLLTAHEDYSSEPAFAAFLAAAEREVRFRAADVRFVLDRIAQWNMADPAGRLTRRLALDHIGIFGYSLGGGVAEQACTTDTRLKACLDIDGLVIEGAPRDFTTAPLFFMQSRATGPTPDPLEPDDAAVREAKYNLDQAAEVQRLLRLHGGYLLEFTGAAHGDFSDSPFYSPLRRLTHSQTRDPRRMAEIVRRYVVAFFDKYLKSARSTQLDTPPPPYPGLRFSAQPAEEAPRADGLREGIGAIATGGNR